MEKNIPKSSSNVRENLKNIPDDLFDRDANIDVKAELLKKQFNKDPLKLALLVKRMINETK
jgi:hypothetical protein